MRRLLTILRFKSRHSVASGRQEGSRALPERRNLLSWGRVWVAGSLPGRKDQRSTFLSLSQNSTGDSYWDLAEQRKGLTMAGHIGNARKIRSLGQFGRGWTQELDGLIARFGAPIGCK